MIFKYRQRVIIIRGLVWQVAHPLRFNTGAPGRLADNIILHIIP